MLNKRLKIVIVLFIMIALIIFGFLLKNALFSQYLLENKVIGDWHFKGGSFTTNLNKQNFRLESLEYVGEPLENVEWITVVAKIYPYNDPTEAIDFSDSGLNNLGMTIKSGFIYPGQEGRSDSIHTIGTANIRKVEIHITIEQSNDLKKYILDIPIKKLK